MKKYLQTFVLGVSLMAAQSWGVAADSRAVLPDQTLVKAENTSLNFRHAPAPTNLVEELRKGGHVIVFRYTGSGGDSVAVAKEAQGQVIDDGQRISENSIRRMKNYGQKYQDLAIPVKLVVT